mmetsp:Transcript_71684/g.134061  ORF Transcript_71684/g.134061 Transcript_71684/m.134061 type:complete len:149 (-) Transcript_71684:78-524(-)
MPRRWVLIEDLGPRTNWSSIRAKALLALGQAYEGAICGGHLDRRRRAATIELADEETALKVCSYLDGFFDKEMQQHSREDLKPWKAHVGDEAEVGGGLGKEPSRFRTRSHSPRGRTQSDSPQHRSRSRRRSASRRHRSSSVPKRSGSR